MNPFPILGPKVAPMIGRSAIMQQLMSNYAKPSPAHLSVVGPRFSGKSVLLNVLAENIRRDESSPFKVVVLWDLGHQTPINDENFLRTMCKKIGSELRPVNEECADILLESDDPYNDLREVIELLASEEINILMLWDGFDKALGSGALTRNLWDNLRALAHFSSIRLITASRKFLQELIRDPQAKTSDFWNIFAEAKPILINTFDEDDQNAIHAQLENIELTSGAKKDLLNWTGGFPPLYLSMINQILGMSLNRVDHTHIKEAAKVIFENNSINSILDDLWRDCSKSTQDIFLYLIDKEEDLKSKSTLEERNQLTEKGLAKIEKNKIIKNCRLMADFILDKKQTIGNVARLFRENDNYQKHIRSVLEHRLNQIKIIDNCLKELIEECINKIPQHPKSCLQKMPGILDETFNLIWDREFPDERKVPQDWITEWQLDGRRIETNQTFPSGTSSEFALLQNMTGAYPNQSIQPKAKHTKKSTYYFLDSIRNFRNYGQHRGGEEIPVGAAVTAVMACIELAASLDATNKTEETV
jgi:hypothetical protein